jgi:hypothetical protein
MFQRSYRSSDGVPDVSRPEKLAGTGFNEILEVAAQVYVPIGAEANRWIGTNEFLEIAELWGRSDLCFGNGDANGLTLEASIGSDTALNERSLKTLPRS